MRPHGLADIVIFDIDDALIDREEAQIDAAQRTVDVYLTKVLGLDPSGGPLYTFNEIQEFQRTQKFQDPFEMALALLLAALHWLPLDSDLAQVDTDDATEFIARLRESGKLRLSLGQLSRSKDLGWFSRMLRSRGGGRKGLRRVTGLRNRFLALAEGHILMDNLVRRTYEECYLGEELFKLEYGQARRFAVGGGSIDKESCWLGVKDMAHLRKRSVLGGVTGRRQTEVQFVLDNLGVDEYVEAIVTRGGMGSLEDAMWLQSLGVTEATKADYATKVSEAIERIRGQVTVPTFPSVAYVGNCAPEDRLLVMLKERYQVTIVGCLMGSEDKSLFNAMRQRGADMVVSDPRQLLKVLSERPRLRHTNSTEY